MNNLLEATHETSEQERSRRNRVYKKAFVVFPHQVSKVPCILRNISETGALIQFEQLSIVPNEMELHVELDGYRVNCQRIRQMGNKVAIAFIGEKESVGISRNQVVKSSTDPLTKLKEREKELKAIIANQRMHQYGNAKSEQEEYAKPVQKLPGKTFGRK